MVETVINLENDIKKVSLREFRTNLVPDIKKRIDNVEKKLNLWLHALKDLDARKSKAASVHYLESEIRDLVHRLQNVLETYFNVVQPRRGRSIIRKFIDDFKSLRMVDLEIKEINMQIMKTFTRLSILKHAKTTEETNLEMNLETETRQKLRKSISDAGDNHIVGMDDQVKDLKSVLLDGKDGVICICGSGGIGKTALAHKLFGDPDVQSYFYICSAVEIGQIFAGRNVLGSILEQLPEGRKRIKHPGLTPETLAEHFNKYGEDERYLFVLDDIRSMDDWNSLRGIFPKNQRGSKLMLTTRLIEVANRVRVDDGHVHMMWPLSRSHPLELFQNTAPLEDHRNEDDSWKKGMMHEVLNLCSGLPSAIVAVREVLAAKRTSNEWETVLQDMKLLIDRDLPVEQIVLQKSIPALIFYDLPYHLKPCFLYLGLFPKGSKIEVEHLYLQWMAEGMISRDDCQNNETMMDLAERYLSDLVQRKMVEVEEEETSSLRKYKSCCIHDNMQEQCSLQGKDYSFKVLDKRSSDSFSSTRNLYRVALHLGNEDDRSSVDQLRKEKVNHLRSLLILNLCDLQMKLEWPRRMSNLKRYRMLWVLTFERVDFQETGLPSEMTWPIYLRYLSFKGCILRVLPSSIGKLSFLEILDLRVSGQIIIPNVLRKMVKLVYLYLPLEFQTPNNDKLNLGSLKELEILENFDPVVCNVADLFKMTRLRHLSTSVQGILGDLEENGKFLKQIVCLMDITSENTSVSIKVRNFDCYTEERHSVFRNLLRWQILHTLHIDGHLGQIPPHDKITSSLTEMVLIGSQLTEDPMKILDKLPELQVLVLQDDAFVGIKMRCVKFSFKKLKRLELLTLHSLEIWEVQKKSMPMLSILAVKNCRKLRNLPHGLRERVSSVTHENDN